MACGIPSLKLNNGKDFPILGFGTWAFEDSRPLIQDAVYEAIKAGYRHIDTASLYHTEQQVGNAVRQAIHEGIVKREDILIVTKVWSTHYRKEKLWESATESNSNLGLGYIDLLLLHFPVPFKDIPLATDQFLPLNEDGSVAYDDDIDLYNETWKAMEELVDKGITKSIGVSSFNCEQIETLVNVSRIKPVVNQVECHPLLPQDEMIELCKKHGIVVTAFSPFGGSPQPQANGTFLESDTRRRLLSSEIIHVLASKYGKSAYQILLKFQVQRGVAVIPKSTKKERIIANSQIFDFELSADDMKQLASLKSSDVIRDFQEVFAARKSKYFPFNDE